MNRYEFRAYWPVANPRAANIVDLFEQATADLPAVARRHRASLHGRPRLSLQPAANSPGCGQTSGFVIVARCAATQLERPSDRAVPVPAEVVTPAA